MKKHAFLLLLTGLFFTKFSFGQKLSVKDSINTFYDSLFYHLESRFLYKDRVNWTQVKPYIKQRALQSNSFTAALKVTSHLFDTIGGAHLNILSPYGWYKSNLGKRYSQQDFSTEFLKNYQKKHTFTVKVLKNHYGYIKIPGMLLIDISQDSLNRKTQSMYDAIMKVQQANQIKGWVIDLRFNIGGNTYPMLAALYHLLGDTIVYKVLDPQKKPLKNKNHSLKKGAFYSGNKMETFAKVTKEPQVHIPVALIIGKITNSAGEFIAVAFRGRKNAVTIGENSYGSLTCNDLVKLPFEAKVTLTCGYAADQYGVYTKEIQPTIKVSKQDNFSDLTQDKNIIEAIKFIDAKHKR